MADFFKSLKIDAWYIVLVYLGGLLLLFSVFVPAQWVTNKQMILVSSGMLLIGLGEWKNHKWYGQIKPPNAYTGPAAFIQTEIRQANLVGIILVVIGVILIILGITDLINNYFHFLPL